MKRVFVAGCGFTGLALARRLHAAGWEVIAGTHSRESAAALAGEPFTVIHTDICDREVLHSSARSVGSDRSVRSGEPGVLGEPGEPGEPRPLLAGLDVIVHCASSSHGGVEQYRQVYLEGARNLLEVLQPGQLVFTGSTSVYAQNTSEWVTEESEAAPDRETGRVLRATEELVLGSGGIVARLAGIYGPGRSVLLRKFFSGEAVIEGDGLRWVNQVHRDDIASALEWLIRSGAGGLFNVCDDQPLQQRPIYEWLAARFERPLPPAGPLNPDRKRGVTNKRVSNAKLRATGWQPLYSSFLEAVKNDPQLLAALQ